MPRSTRRSLTPDEARRLVAAIEASEPLERALLTVVIFTGMRKGEALGLRWSDVDFEAGTVHVQRTLYRADGKRGEGGGLMLSESAKTARSNRVLPLEPPVVAALKAWRRAQNETKLAPPTPHRGESRETRSVLQVLHDAGREWGLGFPSDMIFTTNRGRPLDVTKPGDFLNAITKTVGIDHVTPHELRHSWGSLALGAGAPLLTVSRALGHSSVAITADVYAHEVTDERRAAAAVLAGVLTGTGGG